MNNSLSALEQARELIDKGHVTQAAKLLDEALLRDPKSAEVRFLLGVVHFKKGEWSTAERMFRDAVALSNRHVLAHYYLGLTLERQHRIEDARLEYQFALTIQPNFALAKEKLTTREATVEPPGLKQKIDATERPVFGDREEGRGYKGDLLFSGKRRMRSFSGLFLLQGAALILAIVFWFVAETGSHDARQLSAPLTVLFGLIFVLLFIMLYFNSVTTHYWIYERRIDIKTGLFWSKEHSIWTYEIEDTALNRSLPNRITGDATVTIETAMGRKAGYEKITGLGDHIFMKQLWEELRDAALVERRAMKRWWI